MKQPKPQNSVTRRMEALMSGADYTQQLPVLPNEDMAKLEKLFPPRTKGRGESDDEHARYAGQVELVERLRARLEDYNENRFEDEVDTDISLEGAEKATP